MRKISILLSLFFVCSSFSMSLNIDSSLNLKPEPLPDQEFKFPSYKKITLDNGLKVFIIEDKEQPAVTFRLLVGGGSSADNDKPGLSELFSQMLTKGTKKLDALTLAKTIDATGASLYTNSNDDYITIVASGLTKHIDPILNVFGQVITAPSFPEKELNKLKPRFLAKIKSDKGDPRKLAANMSRKILYGEGHPYSNLPDEKSVASINTGDLKKFYKEYFIPNNSTLAIIGDINTDDIINELNIRFKSWKKSSQKSEIEAISLDPAPLGVYFIERPGSVQSTILFTAKTVPYNHNDYDPLTLTTNVISGGISGRLFKTLREEHSLAYSPFGNLSQNKFGGVYFCGADVKKEFTDSALTVLIKQINSLGNETPNIDEINRVKTYLAGSYKMSFENFGHVATLIQNADFYAKNIHDVETYANKIMAFSPYNIRKIANQYLKPAEAYLIVIGSPEVKDKLSHFGKIYDFNTDFIPLSGENAIMEKVGYDPDELNKKYIDALGGKENLDLVKTLIDTAKAEMISGDNIMNGTLIQVQKAPNKKYMLFDLNLFKQESWVDGDNVWYKINTLESMSGDEADKLKYDAMMFKDTKLRELNYKREVLGKQNGQILMSAISPNGFKSVYYFDEVSFLISKIERNEKTSEGIIPITEYIREYVEIDNIMFPKVIETISPIHHVKTYNNYTINPDIEDGFFNPK